MQFSKRADQECETVTEEKKAALTPALSHRNGRG
jgi:hypothetical protein